jgi:hypothetical protein
MFEAEAPISETWLKREESAGWMADAAGFNKSDEIPGSTPVGKVGMITAFPIVLTALVASAKIDETAETSGTPVMLASTAVACENNWDRIGCKDAWALLGRSEAPDNRLLIAWTGSIDTVGEGKTLAALVASPSNAETLATRLGSTTVPEATAPDTCEIKEAISGCTEVWMSPGNWVASDRRLDIAWRGSTVTVGIALTPPAALVASESAAERLEIKLRSTTPVAATLLICETKEAITGWTEVWISPGSLVASESKLVIAWRGSAVTAGVESASPAAEVALERMPERLETRSESTTPAEAPALIWDINEDTIGCTELWISAGSWVASPSRVETAWRGSTVRVGVDNASPAATVPSERMEESEANRLGSTEPVAAPAVTCETRDEMVGASEVWISPGNWVPSDSNEETTWIGSAVMNAVGSIAPSPGRPDATFNMDEMTFVTWGSTVAEASKPEATESKELRAGFTLLCTSAGRLEASDRRDDMIEIGSAVTASGTRGAISGMPVTSTRIEESAKLAPTSPTVAEAWIWLATDKSEERGDCTLLITLAGKLETSENKDEIACTGSAVNGFSMREAISGMPVTSTRTEDTSEVAIGSTTFVATLEASPNKDDNMGTAVAWTSAGRVDTSESKEEMIETGSNVAVFVISGRRDVSPPRIWVDGEGSKFVRPPSSWLVGDGSSVVKSPSIWVLRSGSREVSPPRAWVFGGGRMDVKPPRTSLVGVWRLIVAPKLALRFGSAKSDDMAETASWGISVCVGLLTNEESTAIAVGTEPAPCASTSERTEEIRGKNEAPVGDKINDDKTAFAEVGKALSASKDEIPDITFAGASVTTGAWTKDDKSDTAKAASPETWFPAAEMIEEIPGRMFDCVGAASKDDNAMLAEVGREPKSSNEDKDGKASWGTPVWLEIWIKELNTDTADVTAPVARLPMTEMAEFTPGRIEISTGMASKVVEGMREVCEACSTTDDTTPANEDASAVLLTAISEMTESIEGNNEIWVGSARISEMTDDADVGSVPSSSNDEMAMTGAPVAIGIATRVVEGIKIIVADGMLVILVSNSEIAEEAALGKEGFSAKDDRANDAWGRIVAWLWTASIEEMRDTASLGRPVFEATRDESTLPTVPLGTWTAAVGVMVPGKFPTFVNPPSNSDTADDAALGNAVFCAKEDNASEASGKMVACVVAPRIDEIRDKSALGRAVLETTSDDKTLPATPLGIDKTAVALAILVPIISVGIRAASALRRPVAAIPRQRTSVHVVRTPFVPLTITGAIKVVSLAAAAPCANDRVGRSLDPRTDVGRRATLTPSRLLAATFKQSTSEHVVVIPPLEAVIVIGWARLVAVGAPARLAPRASEFILLLPNSVVGRAPALLRPKREVAAVCKQNTSEHVVVMEPSVAVITTGSARPVWDGTMSVPRSFPSTEEGINPALMPSKEEAASWTHMTSVHTVVLLPSVATTVTSSDSIVAVGALVTPKERVAKLFPARTELGMRLTETESRLDAATERQTTSVQVEVGPPLVPEIVTGVANVVAVRVIEAVGTRPKVALANPVTATLRHNRSVQVVWTPFVDTITGLDSVVDAWLPPRPRERPTRLPLDDGKAPTLSPSPPICALKQTRSEHVVVADVRAAELVDAAIAKDETMLAAWPERVAVPEVMSEAIDDNIELTFPGMAAAFERTLAKDTKEDCGWLAMTDTWEASEATAAGSVLIEDAVRSDAIAAVLELAPVTPLKAWETWKPRLVGNAVAADKTEFRDDTAWVLLVATGFARILDSRDATLEVWPSTTAAMDGNPDVVMPMDTPVNELTELSGRVAEDKVMPGDTPTDTLTELKGRVAAEEMTDMVGEDTPEIVAEDKRVAELAMDSTLLEGFPMDSTLLAELPTGNAMLEDIRVVKAVVEDPPEPPRPTDEIAELWAPPSPRFWRSVVPELPPIKARFSRCSCS